MDACGIGLQALTDDAIGELLSMIGLGKLEASTPSTVAIKDDETKTDSPLALNKNDALDITRQLTYGMPEGCAVANDDGPKNPDGTPKFEVQHMRCNPNTCRRQSGMCVDCTYCLDHCVCGDNHKTKLLPKRTPSKLPEKAGIIGSSITFALAEPPTVHTSANKKNGGDDAASLASTGSSVRRYNMGDDDDCYSSSVYLSRRNLEEHRRRSSNNSTCSGSHHSYNSSHTGGSSRRRRYNFGDEADENYHQQHPRGATGATSTKRGHRRTESQGNGSHCGSKKSQQSERSRFSLLRGRRRNQSSRSNRHNNNNNTSLVSAYSFDTDYSNSRGSGVSSARGSTTRSAYSTSRRVPSNASSLSSSSRSYLEHGGIPESVVPAKKSTSWFQRRSKE